MVIPNRELLLTSMFSRAGVDLVVSAPNGIKYIVKGFFLNEHLPTVSDGVSTHIPGELAGQFAGSIAPEQYAAAAAGAPGPVAGVVRSLTGVVRVIRASDGSEVQLKIGDPLYQDDIVETDAGAQVGLVFVDGTTLALGENGELVLDELVYDPSKAAGKGTLRLVSGAAEFVSGGIAKSGADNMVFQTPVATIGIRGTRVLATYDPVTGDVTVVNRPTGTDAAGNETAGRITLTLPNGTVIGDAVLGNNGWQWNADPVTGLPNTQPAAVQFTPQQIQNIASAVLDTVNNLQTQIQQQPNLIPTPQGGGTNAPPPAGPTGDAGGTDANAGGTAPADTAPADGTTGPAPPTDGSATGGSPPTTPAPQTTQTPGINTGNVAGNLATTGNPNAGTTGNQGAGGTGNAGTTTGTGTGTGAGATTGAGTTTTVTPVTNPVVTPPPPPTPVLFSIEGGATSDAAQSSITFTITRSGNVGVSASVNYATASGSAGAGVDFTANAGTVTFNPGETSKTVTITVLANANGEPEESFSVSLNGASAGSGTPANIIGGSASGTIAADPPLPSLSIAGVTVIDAVAGTAVLIVTRTGFLDVPTTVTYQTAPGSAVEGSDFSPTSGSISFAAGQVSAQVSVAIAPDSATVGGEAAETFTVALINPVGGLIDPAAGTATVVIAQDPLATFSISADAPALEGSTAVVTVTRGGDISRTVAVGYAAESGSATVGTDTGGADAGLLVFGIGVTTQTISFPIVNDTIQEQAESFTVSLRNPVGGTIGQGSATVSILADPVASYAIDSVQVAEGATAILTVTRAGDLTLPGSVSFATAAGSATSPGDFQSASGTLTFAAGQASATISIATVRDNIQEQAESFTVQLSNPVRGTIANGTGTVSVSADPPLPTVSISGGSTSDTAPGSLSFTITLSAPATTTITVDYTTENGSATAGSDFTATSGTVTFLAGQTTQTVSVAIAADSSGEDDESFTMRLTGALGAIIAGGSATGTISGDVVVPNIALSGGTTVSDATATSVVFTVTLSAASSVPVSVDYATLAGTADSSDFGPQSGTLTFSPGTVSLTITVPIHAFGTNEPAETFSLALSNASGGVLTTGTAHVTISADPSSTSATIATLLSTQGSYNNQNVIVTDSANIADIKTVDAANGSGTVTPTTIGDTSINVMRAAGYVGTATNVAFTDVVGAEILRDFDIKTNGTVSAAAVSGTASALLGSGAAYIANKNVEVAATATLANGQLASIDTANGAGNVTVVGSGALLSGLVTSSVITSGYNVRVIGPVTIGELSTIKAVVPGVTYGAVQDTAANIMTYLNGGGIIAGHPAIVIADGAGIGTDLNNIDAANGANPPGNVVVRGTLANLLASDNFGTRQVTVTSGVTGFSAGDAATLLGKGAALVVIEDTAQNIISAGISGNYSTQLLGSPSLAEIGQIDTLNGTGTVFYGAVADTAANLLAGTARLTAFPNITPIITGTATTAQVEQVLGIVDGAVGLMNSAANLAAMTPTFAGTLLPIVPMVTGSATIQQLLDIEPISPIATSYKDIADTYAHISANLNFVSGDVNLTITDPITQPQHDALDALTSGSITWTLGSGNQAPMFAGTAVGNTYIQFDGTDDYVATNGTVPLQSHTVEMWIRTTQGSGAQKLSDIGGKAFFMMENGYLQVQLTQGGETKSVAASIAVANGEWHHVSYSFDAATGEIAVYVDTQEDSLSRNGGDLGLGDNFAASFTVNGYATFGYDAGTAFFRGDMGEVRVWDDVRTAGEIETFHASPVPNNEPGLKLYYTFADYTFDENNGTGSVTNQVTGGSGLDGTGQDGSGGAQDAPMPITTGPDNALRFNGYYTQVDTHIHALDRSFTLSADIRLDHASGDLSNNPITIFGKAAGGSSPYSDWEIRVYVDTDNTLVFDVSDGTSSFGHIVSGIALQKDLWYSVAATYDASSGEMRLYVDGAATGGSDTVSTRHTGSETLKIGHLNAGDWFSGDVARVGVWETALDVNAVAALTHVATRPDMNSEGLVAFYSFGDGEGYYAADSVTGVTSVYTGAVSGSPAWIVPAPPIGRGGYDFEVLEDTPFTFRVTARDPDPGALLSFTVDSGPVSGTVSGPRYVDGGTAEFTYIPDPNYVSSPTPDQITVSVDDGTAPPVTQVITFHVNYVNDRPILLGLNEIPDVEEGETNPAGVSFTDIFAGQFLDPDGSFIGAVVVRNEADLVTEGIWQWSPDSGTSWYDIGAVANDGTGLILSAGTQLRFVPAASFPPGSPPALLVRALDSAYAGAFSTSGGGGRVTVGAQIASQTVLMGPPTPLTVEVVPQSAVTALFTGSGDDWFNTANWSISAVPGTNADVVLNGSDDVLFDNGQPYGGANAVHSIHLQDSARLTIARNGTDTGLGVLGNVDIATSAQLTMDGGDALVVGGDMTVDGGFAGTGGALLFSGESSPSLTIDGAMEFVDADFSIGGVSSSSLPDIYNAGFMDIVVANDDSTLEIEYADSFQNAGVIRLFNSLSGNHDAVLHLLGSGQFVNTSGGIVRFHGSDNGTRRIALTGQMVNVGSASPGQESVIDVNADAVIGGSSILNTGIIDVAAGKTLTYYGSSYGSGYLHMQNAGSFQGSFAGTGTVFFDDSQNGGTDAYFRTYDGFTLQAGGPTLRFGSFDGNNSARWMAEGLTTVNGVVNVTVLTVDGSNAQFVVNGTMNVTGGVAGANNIHASLFAASNYNNTTAFRIGSAGTLTLAAGTLANDATVNADLWYNVTNDGTINMTSDGADVWLYNSGSYDYLNPSSPNNQGFTNNGAINVSGTGAASIGSSNFVNAAAGVLTLAMDTRFYGRGFNFGEIVLHGGKTLVLDANTDFVFETGSELTYTGTGIATIALQGGASSNLDESHLVFKDDFTLAQNVRLVIGQSGTAFNYVSDVYADGPSLTFTVEGGLDFKRGSLVYDTVLVKNGGFIQAVNAGSSGVGAAVTVESGGRIEVKETGNDMLMFSNGLVTLDSGAVVLVEDNVNNGKNSTLGFQTDVDNSGEVTLTRSGGSADDAVLHISEHTFTNLSGGVVDIGSNVVEIHGSPDYGSGASPGILRNQAGGTLTLASGGAINIFLGTLELNAAQLLPAGFVLNLGDTFYYDNIGTGFKGTLAGSGLVTNQGEINLNGSTISAHVVNTGTVSANRATTLNLAANAFDNASSGVFAISSGVTVNVTGGGAAHFNNQSGATLNVAGTLNLNGGALTNGGAITGSGTISMGGGTYTNNGTSSISPGASPGRLTIDGNAVFGARSRTVIELGGRAPKDYDTLAVTGRFAAGGTLVLLPWLSFAAAAGDSFDVFTWGAREGMFHEASGLAQFGGVALDTVFGDHGLTLVARAVTHEGAGDLFGGAGDDAIVGRGTGTVLDGGAGDDLLLGGDGGNRFVGGAGSDRLIGGLGTDTADYSADAGGARIDLAAGTAADGFGGTDTLISIEDLIGTDHADILIGSDKDNMLAGGGGADTLTGGAGADVFVLRGPEDGGDTITDFTPGEDRIALADFGLGAVAQGVNFSVVEGPFDGAAAGDNAAFAAGAAALIFSLADSTLYYDANGAAEGYSVVAATPGAVLAAGDIQIYTAAA